MFIHAKFRAGKWTTPAAIAIVFAALAGCTEQNEWKGFLDPTATGRWQSQPLTVPILPRLDAGIEEPNTEFITAVDPVAEDLKVTKSDYVIGAGDLLSIAIPDLVQQGTETQKVLRVTDSGNISLPLLTGKPIKAAGLTEAQLELSVAEAYRSYLPNAQVSITVTEARARTFSILGAVSQPGQYAIVQSDFRVLDALVLAHDITQLNIEYLYIIRKLDKDETAAPGATSAPTTQAAPDLAPHSEAPSHSNVVHLQTTAMAPDGDGHMVIGPDQKPMMVGGGANVPETAPPATATAPTTFEFQNIGQTADEKTIRVNLERLRNGELSQNIVVRPNDMIFVPQPLTGVFYMAGHVQRTGVYNLTGQKITLKQAVTSAGMFDQLAIPGRTEVIRRIGPDKEVFVKVDLDKIFAGEQADIYLKPNDTINVGTNAIAPFLAALRSAFRMTYGFGFLYDRNFNTQNNNSSF